MVVDRRKEYCKFGVDSCLAIEGNSEIDNRLGVFFINAAVRNYIDVGPRVVVKF